MQALRIALVGAGAVGGYFAAPLARAGHQVSVVARGATLAAIRRNGGLTLEMQGQRFTAPVQAGEDASAFGPQDIVLLAVKAPSLPQAARHVPPLLGRETVVLPLLNGIPWWFFPGEQRLKSLDPEGVLERSIPLEHIVGSVVFPSLSCPEPAVTVHASGTRMVFGEPGGGAGDRVQRVVQALRDAGHAPEAASDIRREVWLKLLGNACFNPVSLVTGSHTDDMIDDERVNRLFTGMIRELLALGAALGIPIEMQPAERLAFTRKLGHIKTSMLQDAEAHRAVEIDAILGAPLEAAERLGVPVPLLETVYALARRRATVMGLYPAR
jgi:2-dehydropantoate 2-reductase